MNRTFFGGIALFFAVLAIAVMGNHTEATAGHGCGGCGGGLFSHARCHGGHGRLFGGRCHGASCGGAAECGGAADCGGSDCGGGCHGGRRCHGGLLARLKARKCHGCSGDCGGAAPACEAPACGACAAPACEACAAPACDACAAPACDGCAVVVEPSCGAPVMVEPSCGCAAPVAEVAAPVVESAPAVPAAPAAPAAQ